MTHSPWTHVFGFVFTPNPLPDKSQGFLSPLVSAPFTCCYIFTFSSIKTKDRQRQGLKMSQIFYWVIKQTGFKHLFLLFRSGCASSWKSGKMNQIIHTCSQKWLTLIVIILQEKWNREFFLWDKSTLSCFGQSGASSGTPFINNTFSRYFTI